MTNSALLARQGKEGREKLTLPEDSEVTITKAQLRMLLRGLCVWNCPAVDMLTENGRKILFEAQDLAERLWREKR